MTRSALSVPAVIFLSTPSGWRATAPRPCFAKSLCGYFYPRPPGGGRQGSQGRRGRRAEFLSTPSGWRATSKAANRQSMRHDFYPRPPGGGRQDATVDLSVQNVFLSTPSGWRATCVTLWRDIRLAYFYPRPPGGGRQKLAQGRGRPCGISIHALRVEGDDDTLPRLLPVARISIHALRVEGDCLPLRMYPTHSGFLSTPSGWRATFPLPAFYRFHKISIHALRVEGDHVFGFFFCCGGISIHALRVEGDGIWDGVYQILNGISIHALRVEGDQRAGTFTASISRYFYPRPPGGGRLCRRRMKRIANLFLSTPSGWRATRDLSL